MSSRPRLGGMALGNGVLVHSPRHWVCAVRDACGELRVASGRKPLFASGANSSLIRSLARLGEALAVLPVVARAMPSAELPHRSGRMLAAFAVGLAAARLVRGRGLTSARAELTLAALSVVPLALAVRRSKVASYHGAEHVAIGSWEHGEPRGRVHERCGSHLVAPLLATNAVGNVIAERLARSPTQLAVGRALATIVSASASMELLAWMLRNPERSLARLLAKPGSWLQRALLTAEPSPAELEVAEVARDECLRLEAEHAEPTLR